LLDVAQVALAVSKYAEGYSRASLLFRMFCDVWYFRNLSPARVSRLFSACTEETRQPGEIVVKSVHPPGIPGFRISFFLSLFEASLLTFLSLRREGEVTSCFYLIVAGVLDVYQEEARHDTRHTTHDTRDMPGLLKAHGCRASRGGWFGLWGGASSSASPPWAATTRPSGPPP
jgi:CRP-like cAMP-binding protein